MNKRNRRRDSRRNRRPRAASPQGKTSPSKDKVHIHWVTNQGWVHTHGMDVLGLPELEIRDCPDYLGESAARILREVCDYMLASGKVVKAGENMAISERTVFHFVKPDTFSGNEDRYDVERLQIVELNCCLCEECAQNSAELN